MLERVRVKVVVALVVGIVMPLLAGCPAITGPRPAPGAAANDPAVVAIQSAGDLGALGCAMIVAEGSSEDVRKATLAAAAARAVLSEPVPSFQRLATALEEGMPAKYAVVSAVVLQRLKARLGQADLIPSDTTAWAMAEEFVATCQQALGGTADLRMIRDGLQQIS